MKKKICPVCDQPVGSMNYCRVCHRFVRHPLEWETRYYLNEFHPAEEADCDYHGSGHDSSGYPSAGYGPSAYGSSDFGMFGSGMPDGGTYYSGRNGKMTKADYLAKKKARANEDAAARAALDARRVKQTGHNKRAQTDRFLEKREKKRKRLINLGTVIYLLIIWLIYRWLHGYPVF